MPTISERRAFNGALERIARLGLIPLWNELEAILTQFDLRVEERKDANGGAAIRGVVDQRFAKASGWTCLKSGGVDWTKCHVVNGTRVCVGVEIQFSARSDLLIVDVAHLRDQLIAGSIDVAVIVTAADALAYFMTDRAAYFSAATAAVVRARAEDHPIYVLGILHDGTGPALPKKAKRTERRA